MLFFDYIFPSNSFRCEILRNTQIKHVYFLTKLLSGVLWISKSVELLIQIEFGPAWIRKLNFLQNWTVLFLLMTNDSRIKSKLAASVTHFVNFFIKYTRTKTNFFDAEKSDYKILFIYFVCFDFGSFIFFTWIILPIKLCMMTMIVERRFIPKSFLSLICR